MSKKYMFCRDRQARVGKSQPMVEHPRSEDRVLLYQNSCLMPKCEISRCGRFFFVEEWCANLWMRLWVVVHATFSSCPDIMNTTKRNENIVFILSLFKNVSTSRILHDRVYHLPSQFRLVNHVLRMLDFVINILTAYHTLLECSRDKTGCLSQNAMVLAYKTHNSRLTWLV